MEVWDPKDKPTVLSQIKKLLSSRTGPLRSSRYLLYPGILFIFVLMVFALLPGCTTMKWPWEKEVPMMNDDPTIVVEETDETANTIACIKLQPECIIDQRN
jgi:hypothetical protein